MEQGGAAARAVGHREPDSAGRHLSLAVGAGRLAAAFAGADLDQLGAVDVLEADTSSFSEIEFHTRPTARFHGSIPAMIDAVQTLVKQEARVLLTAPNQGEVERLASLLQEYGVPYRLGSRNMAAGSETIYSESSLSCGLDQLRR